MSEHHPEPGDPQPGPATPPEDWRDWIDPSQGILLTPRRMRGLGHPIRARLLLLLQDDGPATASQLGRRIGQSSGVTSYHLRLLAGLGFVEDVPERGDGRDRWWRLVRPIAGFTFRSPDDPVDAENVELAEPYMRATVQSHHDRMAAYVDSLSARVDELATLPWIFNDTPIEVTHEEARELAAEVRALINRYRRDRSAGAPPREGAVRAWFQFQMLPDQDRPGEGDDEHAEDREDPQPEDRQTAHEKGEAQ